MYKSNIRRRGIPLQHYLVILALGHQHSTAYRTMGYRNYPCSSYMGKTSSINTSPFSSFEVQYSS